MRAFLGCMGRDRLVAGVFHTLLSVLGSAVSNVLFLFPAKDGCIDSLYSYCSSAAHLLSLVSHWKALTGHLIVKC